MILQEDTFTTKRKALRINLEPTIYGTVAEIGGGQEVARAFFQAGGASGTIAKSISAYDKTFSDNLYNNNQKGRYVSDDRLKKMLRKEFNDLTSLLSDKKDRDTRFFAFANTVETLNYSKTNQGHGWMGVRFQLTPFSEPNEVIIHVKLLENDASLQQYTLGAIGVNLIYACYNYAKYPNKFLLSLMENLSNDRIEINMASMSGPELDFVDNRLLSVQLVKNGVSSAVMFNSNGEVQQPSDMLYKKNVLAFRGSFRPITYTGMDMLKSSFNLFKKDNNYTKDNTVSVCEMTLSNLLEETGFDDRDFLDRIDLLNGLGQNVLVSNFKEYYKLSQYFTRFKINRLRLVLGIPALKNVLDDSYYKDLKGGILEALGLMYHENVKIYTYPQLVDGEIITSNNIKIDKKIEFLYKHLKANRKILDLETYNSKYLPIYSKDVLSQILNNEDGWEENVPNYVAEQIKKRRLFGYTSV